MRELTEKDLEHTAISLRLREMNFDKLLPDLIAEKEKGMTAEEIIDKYLHTADFDKKIYGRVFAEVDIYDLFKEPKKENPQTTEEKNMKWDEVIEEITTEENHNKNSNTEMDIKDADLFDFPNQPFSEYDDEEKENMKKSIALYGIINRLIVRPLKGQEGKYQILAGHNRRRCARELGYETFPCVVRYDLEDKDAEAMQILIDTNLATRKKIKPIDRAKAVAERKKYLESQQYENKLNAMKQNQKPELMNIIETLSKEMRISSSNIKRFLRLNKLNEDLASFVNDYIIPVKSGEQLSYLKEDEQKTIADLLDKNIKESKKFVLSEKKAKILRDLSEKEKFSYSKASDVLFPTTKSSRKPENSEEQYNIVLFKSEIVSILQKLEQTGQEINEVNIKSELLKRV